MMNEKEAFSKEMILKTLLDKADSGYDLLSLLADCVGSTEQKVNGLVSDVAELKSTGQEINKKLDTVLEKLDGLEAAFKDLKNENREINQKIILMTGKLDKIEGEIGQEELEDYYALCQSLYTDWDEFDPLTRRLIPVAEYLFSKLQKYSEPDYSPVILELCRALENEFLLKIFRKYTMDLIRRKGRNLDTFLSSDRANKYLNNKTGIFVKAITKSVRTNRPEYTLGQMNTIMSQMNDRSVVSQSPLLQDFKEYLTRETVASDLLNVEYIRKINDIVEKYRNPSAHPGFMSVDKAQKCKDIMPDRLDYLMDCVVRQ